MNPTQLARRWALLPVLCFLASCAPEPDVVLRVALDKEFSEEMVARFERETGLTVEAIYDVEAQKTVGHVEALRAESGTPRTDVFWNNEFAHTVALAEEGLLVPYQSPAAADIPALYKDPEHRWTGFAARVRVFIVNTDQIDPSEVGSMADLLDPKWAGKCTMAVPLTGTTLTHMAALYSVLGEEAAREHVRALKAANESGQLSLVRSNGEVMRSVRDGTFAFGWTDTDDYNVALTENYPVARVFPDQADDGEESALGAMVIPNTVGLVNGAPHPEAAKQLIDWILNENVEAALAQSRSAQIPVRDSVPRPADMVQLGDLDVMQLDYAAVGREMVRRHEEMKELFND